MKKKVMLSGSDLRKNDGPSVFIRGLKEHLEQQYNLTYVYKSNIFNNLLSFKKYDCIILNSNNLLPIVILIKWLLWGRKEKIITIFHGGMGKEMPNSIKKHLLTMTEYLLIKLSDNLIFVSKMFKDNFMISKYEKFKDKAIVIHNPISISHKHAMNHRKRLGEAKTPITLLYNGGNRIEKGYELITKIKNSLTLPANKNYTFFLVGFDSEHEETVGNIRYAYKKNIKHEEFLDLLKSTDVFISCSKYETFGLALLEAYSLGCRVVSYSKAGALECISNKQSLFVFDEHSAFHLNKAIFTAVTKNIVDSKIYVESNHWKQAIEKYSRVIESGGYE